MNKELNNQNLKIKNVKFKLVNIKLLILRITTLDDLSVLGGMDEHILDPSLVNHGDYWTVSASTCEDEEKRYGS